MCKFANKYLQDPTILKENEFILSWTISYLSTYNILIFCNRRAGRYEVDGYVYNSNEEPKILMTGKWNESMSYQPCDAEGEPLPGTELKEVHFSSPLSKRSFSEKKPFLFLEWFLQYKKIEIWMRWKSKEIYDKSRRLQFPYLVLERAFFSSPLILSFSIKMFSRLY